MSSSSLIKSFPTDTVLIEFLLLGVVGTVYDPLTLDMVLEMDIVPLSSFKSEKRSPRNSPFLAPVSIAVLINS